MKATQEKQNARLETIDAIKNLTRPDIRTPFIIILINFFFVMLSGPFAVIFYAVEIFKDAGVDTNEHLSAILSALVRVAGGVLGIFLVQKLPRLRLAMVTITLMSISMIGLGIVIYLKNIWGSNQILNILPIIFVTMYMFSFGSGVGPLQWVFMGELLPPEYKVLSGIINCLSTIAIFMVTKMFPTLQLWLSPHGTYWLFAAIALTSNVHYYFFVPETKNKSLLEIQTIFKK